ncbi:hypothetical protein V5P93_004265 [Actinokineospora auranticolor]|uniref:Uncharacterized protein n=1 Tax=Actinokineospora auranticolor TaxID=155976 RepID=A0A2S6GIG7_9PSEU|nr:hypothetical protein [Actinokineospora auranticolor]PPK64990.1 hypothetical protein CLV40_11632 [Actinokineospora auranticolor]
MGSDSFTPDSGVLLAKPAGQHPEDVSAYLNGDVYRLTATTDNPERTIAVPNALTTAQFGETVRVPVHAKRNSGSGQTTVTFTATSESNTTTATTTCTTNGW